MQGTVEGKLRVTEEGEIGLLSNRESGGTHTKRVQGADTTPLSLNCRSYPSSFPDVETITQRRRITLHDMIGPMFTQGRRGCGHLRTESLRRRRRVDPSVVYRCHDASHEVRGPCRSPRSHATVTVALAGLALSAAIAGSAAIDLEGVVGFRVSTPPNAKASIHLTASLCGDGWSLDGSTSLGVLPDVDRDSSLAFSVERGGLTLTSKASCTGTDAQCESLTVELNGLSTSLKLREADPKIELNVSSRLGTVVAPTVNPYASLDATLSIDDHWLRLDPSLQVSGSICLYHQPQGNGDGEDGLWVSARFFADPVPCRLSRVALDARLDLGYAVIMGTVGHSSSIPFSIGSTIRTVADPLSLSVSAAYVPGGAIPFRFSAQVEYKWHAF